MNRITSKFFVCLAIVAGLGFVGVSIASRPLLRADETSKQGDADKPDRATEKTAIGEARQSFMKAVEAGDAKAVAAHWTSEGEYDGDDGGVLRGRAAIEKAYAKWFAQSAKAKVEAQVDSLRFPSRDTAIEEGRFKVRRGKEETGSRYSAFYVRENGNWLMAVLRERSPQATTLRDLEWLLGTWSAKRGETEVQTTYEWWGNKAFLRVRFSIKDSDRTVDGFQLIGADPSTGHLRSWTFEQDGGFGEATWSRDGAKWLQDSAGVLSDGTTLSATNILSPLDDGSFTWQSIDRTVDGEEVADLPPIKVIKVGAKK